MRRLASTLSRSPGLTPRLATARRDALRCRSTSLSATTGDGQLARSEGLGVGSTSPSASPLVRETISARKNASGACILGVDPDTNGAFSVMRWGQYASGNPADYASFDSAKSCLHAEPGLDILITDTPTMEARDARRQPCSLPAVLLHDLHLEERAGASEKVTWEIRFSEVHVLAQVIMSGKDAATRRRIDLPALVARIRALNLPAGTVRTVSRQAKQSASFPLDSFPCLGASWAFPPTPERLYRVAHSLRPAMRASLSPAFS